MHSCHLMCRLCRVLHASIPSLQSIAVGSTSAFTATAPTSTTFTAAPSTTITAAALTTCFTSRTMPLLVRH